MDGTVASAPRGASPKARTGLGLNVLVVEDDEQVATVLATLLEMEGYDVAVANTAEAGLAQLRQRPVHLLISDYWLPDRTGAWMLSEASAQNLLRGSQVLVVTAEHRPQGVENLRVLRKPLDLDDFLRVVHDVLTPVRENEMERAKDDVQKQRPETGALRAELTLYISSSSPSSLKALRNLRRLLAEFDASQFQVVVCDLSRENDPCAEEDRIAFTPTLVKRRPAPKVWLLGDLEDGEILSDLLIQSGVERVR